MFARNTRLLIAMEKRRFYFTLLITRRRCLTDGKWGNTWSCFKNMAFDQFLYEKNDTNTYGRLTRINNRRIAYSLY